jgi:hypothetical protein
MGDIKETTGGCVETVKFFSVVVFVALLPAVSLAHKLVRLNCPVTLVLQVADVELQSSQNKVLVLPVDVAFTVVPLGIWMLNLTVETFMLSVTEALNRTDWVRLIKVELTSIPEIIGAVVSKYRMTTIPEPPLPPA